jgi:hypothetical protein
MRHLTYEHSLDAMTRLLLALSDSARKSGFRQRDQLFDVSSGEQWGQSGFNFRQGETMQIYAKNQSYGERQILHTCENSLSDYINRLTALQSSLVKKNEAACFQQVENMRQISGLSSFLYLVKDMCRKNF